jgi:hypothetical protein
MMLQDLKTVKDYDDSKWKTERLTALNEKITATKLTECV